MIQPFPGMTPEQLRLWDLIYGEHYKSFEEAVRRFVQEQFRRTFASVVREVLTNEVTRLVNDLPQFKQLDRRLSSLEGKMKRIEDALDARARPEPGPEVVEKPPQEEEKGPSATSEIPPREDELELEEI